MSSSKGFSVFSGCCGISSDPLLSPELYKGGLCFAIDSQSQVASHQKHKFFCDEDIFGLETEPHCVLARV